MMIHIEYAPIATWAVMASFGFEDITHQAVPTALIFRISQVEAPEDWNLSWVSSHRLYERPYEHEEYYIEETEHN